MVDDQLVQEEVVLGLPAVDHQQVVDGVHRVAVPRQRRLPHGLDPLPAQRAHVLQVHHPEVVQVVPTSTTPYPERGSDIPAKMYMVD